MCFREGVGCISNHPGAFTVVFPEMANRFQPNRSLFDQIRGFLCQIEPHFKGNNGHWIRWKCENYRLKQCHSPFWDLWVVYFPSNPLFAWYLVISKGSVYFWGLKLTFFTTFDWSRPQIDKNIFFCYSYGARHFKSTLLSPKNVFFTSYNAF